MKDQANTTDLIVIGRFGAPFGVKGWIKVTSFTEPSSNILDYRPWLIQQQNDWQEMTIVTGKPHGNFFVVQLPGCDDRNKAQTYTNKEIAIRREQLPAPEENEYYWSDLEGLSVINLQEEKLGVVIQVIATGANDVLVVLKSGKHIFIPYIKQVIIQVDLQQQKILVDWRLDW